LGGGHGPNGSVVAQTGGGGLVLAFFFGFLKPYRWHLLLVFTCVAITTAAGLAAPWLIRLLVQTTRTSDNLAAAWNGILWLAMGLLLCYALRSLGQFVIFYVSHIAAWRVCHDVRMALYSHLQLLSPAFYANRQSGELTERVISDVENLEPLVADVVNEFVVGFFVTVGSVIVLLTLDASLVLVALLPLPIATLATLVLARHLGPAFDGEGEQRGALSGVLQDNLSGIREIQIFNRETYEHSRVQGVSDRLARQQILARKLTAVQPVIVEGATGLSTLLVVTIGGWKTLQGTLAIEDVVAFILYVAALYQPLWTLEMVNEALQKGRASLKRIHEVLSLSPDVRDAPNAINVERVKGDVTFDNVKFAYLTGHPVIEDISVSVKAGQMLALVGHTGAGKSTLVGLLARFYDPTGGRILVDGMDLKDLRLESLRRNLSMVLQDVFLFNGTVRDNLRFGKPDARDEEIVAAARAAHAHEFISALPHGYDTHIGERGVKLSGGQKQRLSLARAILKDAPILILDEATSAVDSETESVIQEALETLRHGRTSVVIAHRLSTVRKADVILVLEHGSVLEAGNHQTLMAKGGKYKRLYDTQFGSSGEQLYA
jgi:ATP-binding cassette, subfamily B, bacterial